MRGWPGSACLFFRGSAKFRKFIAIRSKDSTHDV